MNAQHNPAEILNAQQQHWEDTFTRTPEMFGIQPSAPAEIALARFRTEGIMNILELGAGQGRDTLFFAACGMYVHALDYSQQGIEAIAQKARDQGLTGQITAVRHDVRHALPFADASFDACYSHMLYNMALTTKELAFLSQEIRRVLMPGGLNIYTARNTRDPHYRQGIHRGEDCYEQGGFIVHFFSHELVTRLAEGYSTLEIEEFEESSLPRRLYLVILHKPGEHPQ